MARPVGGSRHMTGRCLHCAGRLAAAAAVLLIGCMQDAVERRFRSQAAALVGQSRHDLAGWQVRIFRAVADGQDGFTFGRTQRIARHRALGGGAGIGAHDVLFGPALQGSQRHAQLLAGHRLAGACGYGFVQPVNELLPFWQRGQLSSLSFPQ
ncbi:hypothetical protein D9M71_591180 [compost metagenome]